MPELQQVLPKYLQIANHLRDRILSGDLAPGDEIPSERALALDWRVSRPTATKALEALRAQGLVEARQGSGTFVLDQLQLHRRARERYMRAYELGRIYAPGEYAEIVSAEIAPAPDHVARALGLQPASTAARRHRVIHSDHGPVEASTSWIRPELVEHAPRLLQRERIRQGTLAYLEAETGRRAGLVREQVSARLASDTERRELGLDGPVAAVLVVHHLVTDAGEDPLEFVEAVYPPDRWAFEQEYRIKD